MHRLASSTTLLTTAILAFTACGDDGGASTTEALTTTATSSTSVDDPTTGATTDPQTTDPQTTDPQTTDPTTEAATEAATEPTTGATTTTDTTDTSTSDDSTTGDTTGAPLEVLVVPGFDTPESAHWSADANAWFVSNINGNPGDKDGNGYISKLAADGSVTAKMWAVGMDGPAGIRVAGDFLYTADGDRIHAIALDTGEITETVTIAGAAFLNDVTVGPDDLVYVTDTFTNSVHRFKPGQAAELVVMDPALDAPNGILFNGTTLHVASVGSITPDDGILGQILRIEGKKITTVGTYEAKLDGIEVDGDSFLVTEFSGKLKRVALDGSDATLLRDFVVSDGLLSTADFGFDPAARVVAVPDFIGGNVAFFTLPD